VARERELGAVQISFADRRMKSFPTVTGVPSNSGTIAPRKILTMHSPTVPA
jgi:hypothetical protein